MGDSFDYGVYSGFFPIAGTSKNIYYLLAESQGDWTKDPLVLWSNGGPGCSSLLGWLTENGDYLMPDNSTDLVKNPYSWNKNATVLYLDHPAGVGFSTCTGKEDCHASDLTDAEDNLAVMKAFFAAFPEYKTHDLWLTGESYAGIYIPNLLWQIDQWNTNATTAAAD